MADSCSCNSEEEHAIMLGALAALKQINDEEKKENLRNEQDCAALAVRRISYADEGN